MHYGITHMLDIYGVYGRVTYIQTELSAVHGTRKEMDKHKIKSIKCESIWPAVAMYIYIRGYALK